MTTDNTIIEVKPILERLEETTAGCVLVQPEVESLLNFIEILSMTADQIAKFAAGLENHIDELNAEKKKGLWTP